MSGKDKVKQSLNAKVRQNNFLSHKTTKDKRLLKKMEDERERSKQMNQLYSTYVGSINKNEPYLQKAYSKLIEAGVIQNPNDTRNRIGKDIQKRQEERQDEKEDTIHNLFRKKQKGEVRITSTSNRMPDFAKQRMTRRKPIPIQSRDPIVRERFRRENAIRKLKGIPEAKPRFDIFRWFRPTKTMKTRSNR